MKKGSILAFALVAAALSQTAGAITATKEYVDRKNTEIRTNTYTKAETDARIAELAPRTSLAPATNYTDAAVSAISNAIPGMVTNEVVTAWSDAWYLVLDEERMGYDYEYVRLDEMSWHPNYDEYPEEDGYWQCVIRWRFRGEVYEDGQEEEFIRTYDSETKDGLLEVTETINAVGLRRRPAETRNAIGLARMSDVAPTVSNTVTKAYVEGLGIKAGISAETATNIAESVVNATVTGVVRAVSFKVKDYIFDPVTEICWRRQMVNGFLDYIAVTNIDVTLPENYEALEALERRDNQ